MSCFKNAENITTVVLTHFNPVLRFIQKPGICFALQNKWLVSMRNATLVWNEINRTAEVVATDELWKLLINRGINNFIVRWVFKKYSCSFSTDPLSASMFLEKTPDCYHHNLSHPSVPFHRKWHKCLHIKIIFRIF